jgi:hypothetical protein
MSSIRQQIRTYLVEMVQPLRETLTLRDDPEWVNDPLKHRDAMPNLTLFAGDDSTLATDNRGRTKQFRVTFKFSFLAPRTGQLEDLADEYVTELTKIMEADIQLGGLADILDEREVESFIDTISTPRAVLLVTWRVQYRHMLYQPEVAY